jgi:hypothetical protein
MAGTPSSPESWREALKFINRCPICSATYELEKARLFAESDVAHLVHFTCAKCQSYFVAMVVVVGRGLSSVGMITDLSFDDVSKLYRTSPLTTDEVIEGYETVHSNTFLHSLILNG